MNVRQIAIIGGAVVLAGAAFVWMRAQAPQPQVATSAAPVAAPASKTQVLVAKRDLMVGDRITPDALGWQDWPEGAVNQAFFLQSRQPKAIEEFANAVVRQAMVTGEPVTQAKLVNADPNTGTMAALLTPGMRATTIAITPDSSVAGFILPNDRVDIVLTRDVSVNEGQGSRNETRSSTILENVRILAIDQSLAQAKDQRTLAGSTATVELTAEDAQKLELADKLGDLSLLLRGYSEATGPTLARFAEAPSMAQPRPVPPRPADPPSTAPAPIPLPTSPDRPAQSNVAAPAAAVKVYRGGQ